MSYQENILEIYKTEYSKYEKTRDIQWKMNIAVWTLLAVFTYYIAKGEVIAIDFPWWGRLVIGILFCLFHVLFLVRIQTSLGNSLRRLNDIASYISFSCDNEETQFIWQSSKPKNKQWVFIQVGVTGILVIILTVIKNDWFVCH